MLFDHDAKVRGDSARFADLPGGQRLGRKCMTGWRSRLGATTGRSQPTAPIWTNFAVVFAGCRLPCPPRMRICRAAAIRPTRRPHLPRCPMLSGDPAYVCASVTKDRFPGETGHEKAPWTIRQDHPGGKAPALTSENAARSSRTGSGRAARSRPGDHGRRRSRVYDGDDWPLVRPVPYLGHPHRARRGRRGAARMSRVPGSRVIAFATWPLTLLGAGWCTSASAPSTGSKTH